ncbi:hypothetical protein ACRQ5Q_13390 [Bradyrhizobium sp. PMVTL-01]|uniref:hypothetical protein n=1 Tax=Bradyrhizobium sp. PMVTL-01 TaxID=3434999 RepID=UPI003F6F6CB7
MADLSKKLGTSDGLRSKGIFFGCRLAAACRLFQLQISLITSGPLPFEFSFQPQANKRIQFRLAVYLSFERFRRKGPLHDPLVLLCAKRRAQQRRSQHDTRPICQEVLK